MKVGDLVIYKGEVPFSNPNISYIPGVIVALYCNHDKEEEKWWLEGGCRCVADVIWAGDPVVQGHVTKHLAVRNESR